MKKILILFAAFLWAMGVNAQEKTMYVMKGHDIIQQIPILDIDSIVFYKEVTKTTDPGVMINGVKWATCNVDNPGYFTATPYNPGKLYQWNRLAAWSVTNPLINNYGRNTWISSVLPAGTKWETVNDPSPKGWRLPTRAEIESLLDANMVQRTSIIDENGMKIGAKFTDRLNGNTLFLPFVRYRTQDGSFYRTAEGGFYCGYWSSTPATGSNSYYLYMYFLSTTNNQTSTSNRGYYPEAYSLRLVAK